MMNQFDRLGNETSLFTLISSINPKLSYKVMGNGPFYILWSMATFISRDRIKILPSQGLF